MVAKNKVKKPSFTELYLISKKEYNIIKSKKSQIKRELHEELKYQLNPGYLQSLPGRTNINRINKPQVLDPSNDETFENNESLYSYTNRDDSVNENIINNENIPEIVTRNGENIINHENIPEIIIRNDGNIVNNENISEIMDYNDVVNIEPNVQNSIVEHIDIIPNQNNFSNTDVNNILNDVSIHPDIIENFNSGDMNIERLNQMKRVQYLKRKKTNQSNIDVINSRIRSDIKKIREKYREDIKNLNRTTTTTNNNNINHNVIELGRDIDYIIPHHEPAQNQINNHNAIDNQSNNNITHIHQTRPQILLNNRNNSSSILSAVVNRGNQPRPQVNTHSDVNTTPSVYLDNVNRDRNINRKRVNSVIATPMSTSQVEGINSRSRLNQRVNLEENHPHQSNITQNDNEYFKKFNGENDPRSKIRKKAKVIIIENTEVPKSRNSELVDRILQSNTNDPYDVLQISKTAKLTYSGLKRKFNALSKKLHPDKEPSPGAHEAFIIMRRAFIDLKKELQISDEINKGTQSSKHNPRNTQRGYGIKKWMKLFK